MKRLPAVGLEASPHAADEPDVWIRVREELIAGRVPVLHFSPAEGMGLRERLAEVAELCGALGTRKFVLLRRRGGLGKRSERLPEVGGGTSQSVAGDSGKLSVINLHTAQAFNKLLPKRDFELLETARQLIDQVEPLPLLVSVTSPLNLLKELFTVKGAGTLIKRGAQVQRFHSYADLDVERSEVALAVELPEAARTGLFRQASGCGVPGRRIPRCGNPHDRQPRAVSLEVLGLAGGAGRRHRERPLVRDEPRFLRRSTGGLDLTTASAPGTRPSATA